MTELIKDPALAIIDDLLNSHPDAIYTENHTFINPPRNLRLLSEQGEAYILARRDPEQPKNSNGYWMCDGATVYTPPSFLLPKDDADVRVIFHDKPYADNQWRLHVGYDSMLLGDYYSGRDKPERKHAGAPLSSGMFNSFLSLLQTSQVMSIRDGHAMNKWYAGLVQVGTLRSATRRNYDCTHPQRDLIY